MDIGDNDNIALFTSGIDGIGCKMTSRWSAVVGSGVRSAGSVSPSQFVGGGWDTLDTREWVEDLTVQFGSRAAAIVFVRAAGREFDE